MTNIWTKNGNRVAALTPGPDDLFVVTMVDGKRFAMQPMTEYSSALDTAEALAERITSPVKVLALSLNEVLAFTGISRNEFAAGLTPADDQFAIDTCLAAQRECNEPVVHVQGSA